MPDTSVSVSGIFIVGYPSAAARFEPVSTIPVYMLMSWLLAEIRDFSPFVRVYEPLSPLKPRDCFHLFCGELEIKNADVLPYALAVRALGDDDRISLYAPPE